MWRGEADAECEARYVFEQRYRIFMPTIWWLMWDSNPRGPILANRSPFRQLRLA